MSLANEAPLCRDIPYAMCESSLRQSISRAETARNIPPQNVEGWSLGRMQRYLNYIGLFSSDSRPTSNWDNDHGEKLPEVLDLPREKWIRVIGPRNRKTIPGAKTVNTTSHALADWQSDLSPFKLGPVTLWDGRVSRNMENAWQFSKVYPEHLGPDGRPTSEWFQWSQAGFDNPNAIRFPCEKGRKPAGSWWNETLLAYVPARKNIYMPLYRDTVRHTSGWGRLKHEYLALVTHQGINPPLQLWDFDAFDHHKKGFPLRQVLNNPHHIMGHAFILAMMLLYRKPFAQTISRNCQGCNSATSRVCFHLSDEP